MLVKLIDKRVSFSLPLFVCLSVFPSFLPFLDRRFPPGVCFALFPLHSNPGLHISLQAPSIRPLLLAFSLSLPAPPSRPSHSFLFVALLFLLLLLVFLLHLLLLFLLLLCFSPPTFLPLSVIPFPPPPAILFHLLLFFLLLLFLLFLLFFLLLLFLHLLHFFLLYLFLLISSSSFPLFQLLLFRASSLKPLLHFLSLGKTTIASRLALIQSGSSYLLLENLNLASSAGISGSTFPFFPLQFFPQAHNLQPLIRSKLQRLPTIYYVHSSRHSSF